MKWSVLTIPLLLSFIAGSAAPPAVLAQEKVLQAGISTDDIKPGMQWNEQMVTRLPASENWFKLPQWASGVWHYSQSDEYLLGMHKTEADSGVETFGMQVDANGQIWHCVRLPYVRRSEQVDMYTVRIDSAKSIAYAGNDRITLQVKTTRILYSKMNAQISVVQHSVEEQNYVPIAQNQMKTEVIRHMIMQNRPVDERIDSILSRVAYFKPIDMGQDGRSYKDSFLAFLHATNQDALNPF